MTSLPGFENTSTVAESNDLIRAGGMGFTDLDASMGSAQPSESFALQHTVSRAGEVGQDAGPSL